MWVPTNSGDRSGSCSENCGFRIAQVVRCHSENGISYSENGISNSESCSENTPELSESSENGLFTPRAFFLKLGWSPGFWLTTFEDCPFWAISQVHSIPTLALQKVHATDMLNGKRETKRNNPKLHVTYVHVTIFQSIFTRLLQSSTSVVRCGGSRCGGATSGQIGCQDLSEELYHRPQNFRNTILLKITTRLVAPYRAILRYYRCDTPYRTIPFQGGLHSPKMVRYPPLVLSLTQAHLCDTPFCYILRDNCAIPHEKKKKHKNILRYYRYKYRAIWKVSLLGL